MSSRRRLAGAVSKHGLLIVASAIALFPVYVMITAAFKTQAGFLAHPWAPIADPTLAGYRAALRTSSLAGSVTPSFSRSHRSR